MGRRKTPAPPPAAGMEKMKKERNRSSLMPFRRGDSSRSRQGTEDAAVGSRPLTPAFSTERAQPTYFSPRNVDLDRQSSVLAHNEGQQETPMVSAIANGTTTMRNQPEAASINVTADNPNSVQNNVFTPPTQVSSLSPFQSLATYTCSHFTNLASHHHLLFDTWMQYLALSRKL